MLRVDPVLRRVAAPARAGVAVVERVSETPSTVTVVDALTTSVPAAELVRLTVQDPVTPSVRQLAALSSPLPLDQREGDRRPAGALTKPPVPVIDLDVSGELVRVADRVRVRGRRRW